MKSKFATFLLFCVMIILIAGIIILGKYMYNDLFSDISNQITYKLDAITTEESTDTNSIEVSTKDIGESIQNALSSDIVNTENNTNTNLNTQTVNKKYFYSQLNETQKIIYDGLNNSKQSLKLGDYVINYGDKFTSILENENGSKELGQDYQTAIEAFTHDNPDLFYLDVNKMYLNIETITKLFKTKYNVYISAANGGNYLSSEFESTSQIEAGIQAIETIKNGILNKLVGTDYQNILFIHDYLVDNIEYDSTYKATGSYSIYGALIGHKCVCEGYAKAFKYLANSAGYECELMQGTAVNSSGEVESHAWDCIKLGDTWYEIDTTWDDPIIIGGNGRLTTKTKYRYFLKGSSTFEKDHTLEYNFSEGGKTFLYPTISQKDYKS